jgi:hypothetical protein
MLVGKYIPNLIAKLFDIFREYAQIIYHQMSSLKLDKVLKRWEKEKWASAENRQKLTGLYLDILHEIATSGTTFKDENTLVTGVGKGVEIVKAFCPVVPTSLLPL